MAGPGRPAGVRVREVTHVRFHLGVQFNGKVFMSMDKVVNKALMHAMPNNRLHVVMNDEEWFVPDSVIHSMKLVKEEPESA